MIKDIQFFSQIEDKDEEIISNAGQKASVFTDDQRIMRSKEMTVKSLKEALDIYTVLVDFSVWKTFKNFLKAFLIEGGVIEATVNGEDGSPKDIEYPVCHLLVLPDGNIQILGSNSMVFPFPYKYWGSIFPQQSLPHIILREESERIGKYFYSRGHFGYLTLEFVYKKSTKKLYCTSMKPYISEHLSSLLLTCLTASFPPILNDGNIYTDIHATNQKDFNFLKKTIFLDQNDFSDQKSKIFPTNKVLQSRIFILTSEIHHQGLSLISRRNFTSLLTNNGIKFDTNFRLGTTFPMFDGSNDEKVTLLVVRENLVEAITEFLINLTIIARNVPNSLYTSNNFMLSAPYFSFYLGTLVIKLELLKSNQKKKKPKPPPLNFFPTALENYLSCSIDLPWDRLDSIPNGIADSSLEHKAVSSNIITLLNKGFSV